MEQLTIRVDPEHAGERIDRYLSDLFRDELSRSMIQKLCDSGNILIKEKPVEKNYKLRGREEVCITLPDPEPMEASPEDIPLDIVHEDDALLVINKPKGMVVHPGAGNWEGTLVNALLHYCHGNLSGIGGVARPGIVHRIDKDTSGLLVVAKTDFSHKKLSESVKAHNFTRRYHAVVYGKMPLDSGTVDQPIGRHPIHRKQMSVTNKNGREAQTHYTVLERYQGFTYLELQLETGRTHQIRVHMQHLGHPVAGDPVYGPKKVISSLQGQCLHAKTLGFVHPITEEYMEFTSQLPSYFENFLRTMRPQ